MKMQQSISPCLWFEKEAEEAAEFYVSVFANSKICNKVINHDEWPGGQVGDVEANVRRIAL